jgi:hypothetical protein
MPAIAATATTPATAIVPGPVARRGVGRSLSLASVFSVSAFAVACASCGALIGVDRMRASADLAEAGTNMFCRNVASSGKAAQIAACISMAV